MPDGITEAQKKALGKYPTKRKDMDAQWSHMLKIIFSDASQATPSSLFEDQVYSHETPSLTTMMPDQSQPSFDGDKNWNGNLVQAGGSSTTTIEELDFLTGFSAPSGYLQDPDITSHLSFGTMSPMGQVPLTFEANVANMSSESFLLYN